MLGFAVLGLLGVGLIFSVFDNNDDDDEQSSVNEASREQGTDGDDLLDVGPGNDTVFAGDGDDLVDAGTGNDRVFGGAGDDLIAGGAGNDFLRGESGDDLLIGGAGEDVLNGDVGDDILFGADLIDAEGLIDATVAATQAGRELSDDEQAAFVDFDGDRLEADTLNGGVGNDFILAGSNDVVDTGVGSDTVNVGEWVDPDAPVNVVGFNPNTDVIVYSYTGNTQPNVFFGEDDSGTATLVVDGDIVAYFPNIDFFDLRAQSSIELERVA